MWKIQQDFGVRALMGVIMVMGAVIVLGYMAIAFQDAEAKQMLGDGMIAVIAFYFGMRKAQLDNGEGFPIKYIKKE